MKSFAIVLLAALGLSAGQGFAQQRPFETPLYTTGPQSTLDKNYGLPTFGMPGSELPRQRTMAPEAIPAERPDVFKGSSDYALPPNRAAAATATGMETPLYTTSEANATSDGTTGGYSTYGKMETELAR